MELERTQPVQPAKFRRGRSHTLLAAAGLLAATAAFNTHAQLPRAGMFFINPAAQYIWYGSDRAGDNLDIEEGVGWQIGAEYMFTDRFALEAVYSEQSQDIDNDVIRHYVDIDDRRWRLDALYYFPNSSNWVPYIAGGAGEGRFDIDVDDSIPTDLDGSHSRETELNLGGGVRYFFNDNVSLRADLRAVQGLDDSKTDAVASLGISFSFGGEKPAPVVAPPEPEPYVAPPPPPPQVEKVKLSSEALFDFNKSSLRPGAIQSLDELSNKLSSHKDQIQSVKVYGHTDRIGSAAYNQKLSEERADSVKDYLISHGVPASKVSAEGKGSSDPVTTDCTGTKRTKALIECLQPDRRVEVHITGEREVKQ
jgi:outer membrane protein OmpA-like peptidoglycan-associated protein